MKIRIDKDGHLWLERAGEMRQQFCPHMPTDGGACGDWCPLFVEPFRDLQSICVRLCRTDGSISCVPSDFTDERGAP